MKVALLKRKARKGKGRGQREKGACATGLDSPGRAGLCHPHPVAFQTKETHVKTFISLLRMIY
jgi:hypothetical protein